ncbi:TPA: hypothetical protein N0F65_012718 [Lagenidium giganteum]|uniref:5'-nucleotidase n=1 Tax=Lagenidium giganteum TaxID=4803 RepID=A0AAV2YGI6_9STRA|nr:TPA: hypothetical protein N0F65_012718 [Lagenidium giganteum]
MRTLATTTIALLAAAGAGAVAAEARSHAPVIDIIAYNDVYEMQPDEIAGLKMGGPSRVIPVVQDMRRRNPDHSLVLFAGDTMSPSLWSFQFKGMQMVEAHNALGVDFACLGNHEFDFDLETFENVSVASNFPWLNANCFETDTGALLRGTVPRAVKQLGDVKVGLFGVMYDMKAPGKGVYWTDPLEAAKEQVKILREQEKVDLVIALTHQELTDDNRLSKDVKGIDIIYGGHEHSAMMQTNFGTPYLKADLNFRTIWSSKIEYFPPVTAKKQPAVVRAKHELIPVTEDMPTDPTFEAIIASYASKIKDLQSRAVGAICKPLNLKGESVQTMDMPIGNIFADAAMELYDNIVPDACLINAGLIRTDKVWPAGSLTLGELISWSPFGNTMVIFDTDGASLKKFITTQMVASCGAGFINRNGFYVHPAGIKYTFQCTGVGAGTISSIEWFKHAKRTGAVGDDEAVRLMMTNYVYFNNYVPVSGLKMVKMVVSDAEAGRIDSALEKYFKKQPDSTLCQKADGRSAISQ